MISDDIWCFEVGVFRTSFSENGHMKHIISCGGSPSWGQFTGPHQRTALCVYDVYDGYDGGISQRLRFVRYQQSARILWNPKERSHWDPHVWWWIPIFFFQFKAPSSSCFMVNSCKNDRNSRTQPFGGDFAIHFSIVSPPRSPCFSHFSPVPKRRRQKKGPTSSLWCSTSLNWPTAGSRVTQGWSHRMIFFFWYGFPKMGWVPSGKLT